MPEIDKAFHIGQRLVGLDGIRGLAALFVMLHHVYLRAFPGYPYINGPFWAGWLIYGHLGVVVFMVLSGFSLAATPARSGWQLDGHRFARRRAWRILPPYWAALVFSLLVAWLIMAQPGQLVPDAKSVMVYGLLLQDVFHAPSPNLPFWTIAVEAHLYVLFPLLLLIVRRGGLVVMLTAVGVVVAAVGLLSPHVPFVDRNLMRLTPQMAALFAAGIVAAGVLVPGQRRWSWPWHWLALAAAAPVLAVIAWNGSVWTIRHHLFWVAIALAPAVACLLAAVASGRPARLVSLLDSRPVRGLGSFSYSLYLTHAPIVLVVYTLVVAAGVPRGVPAFLVTFAIGVPLCIAFARLFAAVFEFPFQRNRGWPAFSRASRPGRRAAEGARSR